MKSRSWRYVCCVMAGCMLCSGMPQTIQAQNIRVTAQAQETVEVTDYNGFKQALASNIKNITVKSDFTIRDHTLVDTNGQMLPIQIPGGTTITGEGSVTISCSHPIQIMGDDVVIKDMEWVFNSTNAMGSVPHREIFLGGHSLTLDRVHTYLPGADSSLGGFGGTKKELLPTVYAGGYGNDASTLGTHASLIVKNADRDNTMFQDIYMGHEASAGSRTAYQGEASLELDAKAKVRNVISAEHTTSATVTFTGGESGYDEISPKTLQGNEHTALHISRCAVSGATVKGIGNMTLGAGGRLQPITGSDFQNVDLTGGGCLDLTRVSDAVVSGSFSGGSETVKGKLVLQNTGSIQIDGQVSGVTQFQVRNHVISNGLMHDHTYITAQNGTEGNFVLSETDVNNKYSLILKNGKWTAYRNYVPDLREVKSVEIVTYPKRVLIEKIPGGIADITDESPSLKLRWKDQTGTAYTPDEIWTEGFFENMVVIRSDDWNSTDPEVLKKTDWSNPLYLEIDADKPDLYYLIKYGEGELKTGTYTLLFFPEPLATLTTVEDVKKLQTSVLGSMEITFAEQSDPKPHEHVAGTPVRENEKKSTCTEAGSYDEVIYCTGCNAEIRRTPIRIPASGHSKGAAVIENRIEPQIGVEGSYDEVVYCTGCNAQLDKKTIKIPALKEPEPPNPGKPEPEKPGTGGTAPTVPTTPTVPAPPTVPTTPTVPTPPTVPITPTVPAPTPVPVPQHQHNYVLQVTKEATCTQEGEQLWICSCGDRSIVRLEKLPHVRIEKKKRATVGENGSVSTICSVCRTVVEKKIIYAQAAVKVAKASYTYDEKAKKAAVTVVDSMGNPLSSSSYEVAYENHKAVGQATVTVYLRGNYSGRLTETFEIRPERTRISDIRSARKSILLKWKKQAVQTDGYEIAYATDQAFSKKSVKTMSVKNTRTVSKKIRGLRSGQTYYVRIRTYKEARSGEVAVRIYSDWSDPKMIVTK